MSWKNNSNNPMAPEILEQSFGACPGVTKLKEDDLREDHDPYEISFKKQI